MVLLEFRCGNRKPLVTVLLLNIIWIASLYLFLSSSHQRAATIPRVVTSQERMEATMKAVAIQPINRSSIRPIIPPTLRSFENKNEGRKLALRRTCTQFGDRIPHLANDTFELFAKFVIVDRARKIMYCPVPKVACTTWTAFFLELNGVSFTSLHVHSTERTSLVHLNDLATEERETVLRNYTKLLIVRHPFTRILSAFRDKLEPNGSFETNHKNLSRSLYYHRNYWRERVGLKIIAAYRGVAAAKRFAETHQEEYDLTFREFTDYIVDFHSSNKSKHVTRDRHWLEMHSLCYPCDIEYDFIAKFETLANDSKHFLASSGLPNNMTANYGGHRTNSSESTALSQFYDTLSVESIKKLYRRYEMDFRLFGYSPNIVLDLES